MVLWAGCFGAWVRHLTRRKVDPRIWTDCKLYYFMFYFGRHYSSILLVLMSIEKCFSVYFPLKVKTVCTVRTAKWATAILGVILAAYNTIQFFDKKSFFIERYGRYACLFNFDLAEAALQRSIGHVQNHAYNGGSSPQSRMVALLQVVSQEYSQAFSPRSHNDRCFDEGLQQRMQPASLSR